jgi:hypothetical protein
MRIQRELMSRGWDFGPCNCINGVICHGHGYDYGDNRNIHIHGQNSQLHIQQPAHEEYHILQQSNALHFHEPQSQDMHVQLAALHKYYVFGRSTEMHVHEASPQITHIHEQPQRTYIHQASSPRVIHHPATEREIYVNNVLTQKVPIDERDATGTQAESDCPAPKLINERKDKKSEKKKSRGYDSEKEDYDSESNDHRRKSEKKKSRKYDSEEREYNSEQNGRKRKSGKPKMSIMGPPDQILIKHSGRKVERYEDDYTSGSDTESGESVNSHAVKQVSRVWSRSKSADMYYSR